MSKELKRYIGDGVYAEYDGFYIWLTLLSGERIALEPEVFAELLRFHADVIPKHRKVS